MKLSGWWKSNKRTSTWAFHVSFFSTVFLCVCRLHLGHFAAGIFFHSSNSHKYICFGWIFFLRLAHIGGRSRTLPFFCCFTRMRTFRSAAICLQVLVQDYLLSAVKHTHTHRVEREWEMAYENVERKNSHTCHGESFFFLYRMSCPTSSAKWDEEENERAREKKGIGKQAFDVWYLPSQRTPSGPYPMFMCSSICLADLSLCFFRRIAIVHLRAHKNRPFHFPSNSFCTLSHSHDKDVIDNQIKEIHWLKYLPIDDKVSERCSHLLPPAQKKTFFVFRAFGRFGSVKADFNSGCDVNQIRRFPPKPLAELSARRKFLRFSKAV